MSRAEKFIKDYTKNCSNELDGIYVEGKVYYSPWLTPDQARKAVEIAKEELMKNVCKFLDGCSFIPTYVINNLKQAMKDG